MYLFPPPGLCRACVCALRRMLPFLPEFAHKESASGDEGHWPAASELTERRPWFRISSNGTKITSTRCVRGWDKWGKCAARMGLIYAGLCNANLEDIAALLLSHKNDRKWDNDADLLPGRVLRLVWSSDKSSLFWHWHWLFVGAICAAALRVRHVGPFPPARSPRETHTHGKNRAQ